MCILDSRYNIYKYLVSDILQVRIYTAHKYQVHLVSIRTHIQTQIYRQFRYYIKRNEQTDTLFEYNTKLHSIKYVDVLHQKEPRTSTVSYDSVLVHTTLLTIDFTRTAEAGSDSTSITAIYSYAIPTYLAPHLPIKYFFNFKSNYNLYY